MEHHKRTVMKVLMRTRRAWLDYMGEIARKIGIPDSYRKIIMYLYRSPGANQKNIADFADITTAAVNQIVKDMIAEGYVSKEQDSTDRRYTKLYLTPKGVETAEKLREYLHYSDQVITAGITPEKEAEMIALLDQIRECIRTSKEEICSHEN